MDARSLVGLLLLWTVSGIPGAATAQSFHDVAAGLSFGGPSPDPFMDFAFRASVGHEYVDGLGWQLDAITSQFHFRSPTGGPISCGTGLLGGPPPCTGTPGPAAKGIVGVDASGLFRVAPLSSITRTFLIVGVEADYLYLYASAVRPGASAGFKIRLPSDASGRVWTLELRYHALLTPAAPTWFLPVTVGFTF